MKKIYLLFLLVLVPLYSLVGIHALQSFTSPVWITGNAQQLVINGSGDTSNGANLEFWGDGGSKSQYYIRSHSQELEFLNSQYGLMGLMNDNGTWYLKSVIQDDQASSHFSTVSTTSTTTVSTGQGMEMQSKYLSSAIGSGVNVRVHAFVSNSVVGDGMYIVLYRSYIGIPSLGQTPNSGDLALIDTPLQNYTLTQVSPAGNPQEITLEYIDVGTNNSNQYYYLAFHSVGIGGKIVMLDHGSSMNIVVT